MILEIEGQITEMTFLCNLYLKNRCNQLLQEERDGKDLSGRANRQR